MKVAGKARCSRCHYRFTFQVDAGMGVTCPLCHGLPQIEYQQTTDGRSSRELLAEFLAAVAALSSEAEGLEHQVEQEYGLPTDSDKGCREAERVDELLPKVAEEFGIPVASRSHEDENRA
jgi:hypothetical protein